MSDMNIRIRIALLIDEARAQLQQFQNQLNNTGNNANLGGAQLSAEAQRIRQANQQARESMDELGRSSLGLRGALQSLIGVFSVFAMYQTAKELIQIADNMKLIDGRIRVATAANVDASEAVKGHDQAYRSLLDISMRTGTSFEANATLFARINVPMQQMGGNVKNTLAFTEMLSKALVISGAGAGETASVIRQMSQAMASGLRGDEFNSVMENGSRVAQALADGLGVNIGALRKMAEAGELTINKVMPALMSQAEKINSEYSTMPATVGKSFERIKTAFDQYIGSADESAGVTDSMAQSLDDMARNFTPIIEGMVAVGRIVISVFAVQAVQALASYGQAQIAAVAAKRELLAMENAHGQALVMNAEMTLNSVTARKAQIQADLQASAQRMNLMRAEVAAAQAEVNATAGTTAHGNAVYRLTVAQQELSLATSQVSALGQANATITAEQTAATNTLNAARQAQNVTLWQSITAMTAAEKAMGLLNAAMSVFMGWQIGTAIGDWLNGFKEVRNEALSTVAVFDKMLTTFGMLAKAAKAGITGGDIDSVMAQYKQDINAIEAIRDDAIAYNNRAGAEAEKGDTNIKINPAAATAEQLKETAKAEKQTLEDSFKLKEKLAKNAYDVEIAKAGDNAAKKLQIEKDYNEKVQAMTLARLDAEKAALLKSTDIKKDSPAFNAALSKIDNERAAALSDFQTQQTKLGISQQEQSQALLAAKQQAQFESEKSKIDLDLAASKAEVKTALDNLKREFDSGTGGKTTSTFAGGDKASYAIAKFMEMGWAKEQAAGIVANLHRESGFKTDIVGDGGKAYGIGQWHPDRQANFQAQFGKSIKGSSFDEQLAFVDWELRNTESRAGKRLMGAGSAREAGGIVSQFYERPADVSGEKAARGGLAEKLAGGSGDFQKLEQQDQARIKEFYEKRKDLEDAGIAANIKAIQAKLALLDKEYAAKKEAAKDSPEKLPKIEADYQADKAKLTQELKQLNGELLDVQKTANAEMQAELNRAKQEQIDEAERASLDLIKIAEDEAKQQLELGNINNQTFLEKQKEFESQRYQIALKAAQDRKALLADDNISGQAKALNAEKNIGLQHAAQMKDINHKMAMDSQASFNSIVSPIKSAFSSTVQGVLQGTTTLKQGLKNMAQSIVLSFANALTNMAIDSAAHWAWEVMGFGAKETTKAGLKTTSEAAQTAATATGVASRTAVEQTGSATSKAIEASTGMSKITTKAASAAAGAYDATVGIPFIGPVLAPVAAAAAFIGVMAFGGMISSSKGGEWNVPDDRLNFVHKNETILPATIAQPMREFFAAGNMQGYGLPAQANLAGVNSAGLATTASTTLAAQQSLLMAQQKQQKQSSGGSVVIHTKGGDFVHKDDLMKILKNNDRNFKTV